MLPEPIDMLSYVSFSIPAPASFLPIFYNSADIEGTSTVNSVIKDPIFLKTPHQIAKKVWEESNKKAAANGGIMRTSILGIWEYKHRNKVILNAEKICKMTHYDPRCVGSCVSVCLVICELLQGNQDI